MSEKPKSFAAPKPRSTRPSTVASSSRSKVSKASNINSTRALNTTISDGDTTVVKDLPVLNAEANRLVYGKYLRDILEECLVDDKIEREETQIDIQMTQLADRFQKTMDQLDKTNRRLKEISFVVEQKRLLNLKHNDCSEFYEITDKSNAHDILRDLAEKEQECVDTLTTKNIDFGYDKETGHKKLLDAVNEAIEGLEQIKKHSKLDSNKFNEFEKTQNGLDAIERDKADLFSLRADFEYKFPRIIDKLLREASERIEMMILRQAHGFADLISDESEDTDDE